MKGQAQREMPRYTCHKQVWALKIKTIDRGPGCTSNEANIVCGEAKVFHTPEAARGDVGLDHAFAEGTFDATSALIIPEDDGYAPLRVESDYLDKHEPQAGGYYVVYADGYKSYSPAKAFEEGYTRC